MYFLYIYMCVCDSLSVLSPACEIMCDREAERCARYTEICKSVSVAQRALGVRPVRWVQGGHWETSVCFFDPDLMLKGLTNKSRRSLGNMAVCLAWPSSGPFLMLLGLPPAVLCEWPFKVPFLMPPRVDSVLRSPMIVL